MQFVSKDWRDPGENWVKTEEGWEKQKVMECCGFLDCDSENEETVESGEEDGQVPSNRAVLVRRSTHPDLINLKTQDSPTVTPILPRRRRLNSSSSINQPYCHITLKCTREIAGFNGLSEALKRLDFRSAVWDVQRFHYICKLLDILITRKLTTLTGGAQKMLFVMLEEVARQVSSSQQNLHVLHCLLKQLQRRLEDFLWWGTKLGSTVLWEKHSLRLQQISNIATNIEILPPDDDSHPKMQEIPEECVREILKRLDNHNDITSAGEAYSVMAKLASEKNVWKDLCSFHWSRQQIEYIICTHQEWLVKRDWQKIYHKLRRAYSLKENYAITLLLCKNCQCLFWESLGHPCIVESNPDIKERIQMDANSVITRVPPQIFLSYFSL